MEPVGAKMETNELMENARAMLAAATPGRWVSGRADGRLHRHGCPALNDASKCHNVWSAEDNRDVTAPCAGLSAADAALIAFAVNNLPALLDALAAAEKRADEAEARERGAVNARIETSHDLHIRLELAEAGAAAMREALVAMKAARDSAIAKRHNEGVALHLEFWSRMVQRNALAADAGAALLARLHAAESEVQRLRKDWDNAMHAATSTMRSELRVALREVEPLRAEVERLKAENAAAALRLVAVGEVLSAHGCDCDCGCDTTGHFDECDLCLACKVNEAITDP